MRSIPLLLLTLLAACNRLECHNTNPVFDNNKPGSEAYDEELVKQINKTGKENLQYWIHENGYVEKDGREYMTVWVQGGDLCAIALMDITCNKELDNYRKVKGMSYSGAGLGGLQYTIQQDSNGYQFVFKEVDRIVD